MSNTSSSATVAVRPIADPPDHRTLPRTSRAKEWLPATVACRQYDIPASSLAWMRKNNLVRTRKMPGERAVRCSNEDLTRIAAESVSQK